MTSASLDVCLGSWRPARHLVLPLPQLPDLSSTRCCAASKHLLLAHLHLVRLVHVVSRRDSSLTPMDLSYSNLVSGLWTAYAAFSCFHQTFLFRCIVRGKTCPGGFSWQELYRGVLDLSLSGRGVQSQKHTSVSGSSLIQFQGISLTTSSRSLALLPTRGSSWIIDRMSLAAS